MAGAFENRSVNRQRAVRFGVLLLRFVEQSALRNTLCIPLEEDSQHRETKVFTVLSGICHVGRNVIFQSCATVRRHSVPLLKRIDAIGQLLALARRERIGLGRQEIAQIVQPSAVEHLHLGQVAARHVLCHLAERAPVVGAILCALHPDIGNFACALETWLLVIGIVVPSINTSAGVSASRRVKIQRATLSSRRASQRFNAAS